MDYQKILEEAVEGWKETDFKALFAEKGEEKDLCKDVEIDTDIEILIPDKYVK